MDDDFYIDDIDQELASNNFDALKFVDKILPNEPALANLPKYISQLQTRSRRLSASTREAVRSYSILGDSSEAILKETRNSIVDLSQRITDMHDKVTETESIVSKICVGIKPLDNAKKNLTLSVTSLRRLKMIVQTVSSLEENVSNLDYSKCAENILALTSLTDYFKKYSNKPQLKPFLNKFLDLKRILKNKINTEFEDKMFRGSADESNLPLCAAVDSFNDGFREAIIQTFCEKFMSPYSDSYSNTPLKEINTRYQWFKQRAEFYNSQYSTAFPKEWRMQYHLTIDFCKRTASDLAQILKSSTPKVKEYLNAFEYTVKFEKKMSENFATIETVYISQDAEMPQFDNSVEGIKKKYEWLNRKENGIGEEKIIPAKEFNGIIANAFSPYMELYFEVERKNLGNIITGAQKDPLGNLDEETHTFSSSATLVSLMKKTIEKTASFNVPQSLLDLFLILKELLVQYAEMLTKVLPSRPKKEEHLKLICSIVNTSSLLLSVVDSLAVKVEGLVPGDMKRAIIVIDAKENISNELKKQMFYLVDVFVKECEMYLVQIANNSWRTDDTTNKLPEPLIELFDNRFDIISKWLTTDNFNRFRSPLSQKIVKVLNDAIFNNRQINSSPQVMQTIRDLKTFLTHITKADSVLSRRRIEFEFSQLEADLTVLFCPEENALAAIYVTKSQKPSKNDFMKIMRLRGRTSADDLKRFGDQYDEMVQQLDKK
ncbi:vacuolar protein sorting-associated protein 53 A [Histomonas meleagridis]|uniref:vacuolar protein sorting-associated protein 53 A n=1 Tax=Histomonas meleagridis TaxID=135588 RepID=UPI0035595844|nr:vacuolar protein sorting-associated protein 53 A [Histomonas meleagridis]KAH0805934.1 vacuolar protein sorting-associated protein 53 A [Histomonas meleagridis]